MKISEIKIPVNFAKHFPKDEKIMDCYNHYIATGEWDRELYVKKNGYIVDGYVKYIVALMLGLEEIPVRIGNKKNYHEEYEYAKPLYKHVTTCYIFGNHFGNNKEYVWRVPDSWHKAGWENDLKPGDMVTVSTNRGVQKVFITRIEVLDECPVQGRVKKVTGWKRVF